MVQNRIKPRSLKSYKNGSAEVWETKRGAENSGQTILHTSLTYRFVSYVQQHPSGFCHQTVSFKTELRVAGREGSHPHSKPHRGVACKLFTPVLLGFSLGILLSVRTASLPPGCVPAEAASNSISFWGFVRWTSVHQQLEKSHQYHTPQLPDCQQALTISSCC